jgi:hypothetical protein
MNIFLARVSSKSSKITCFQVIAIGYMWMLFHAVLILRQLDYVVPSSDNHGLTDAVRFVLNLMGFNLGMCL